LVAARRAAILFPIAGVVSVSAVALLKLVMLICWLCSGNWQSRIKICKQNPVFLIMLLLIAWTFIGVIRWAVFDANVIVDALKHWWSRQSFLCLLILATLYFDKATRIKALASFNIAMLIFSTNFLLVYNEVFPRNIPSCFMLFNTITTGVVLVIWCVYWLHYSFQTRNIPLVRRILPKSILLGMKVASRTSPFDLVVGMITLVKSKQLPFWGIVFAWIRWGVIGSIIYFVFVLNTSRTAQLSLAIVIVIGLLMWNWRKGVLISVVMLACIVAMAASNDIFVKKWEVTYKGVNDVLSKDFNDISHKDRHWILLKIIPEIQKKPIAGHGIDVDFSMLKKFLPFGESNGFAHTHCEFTQVAIQFGLVGVGLFIIFILLIFYYSSKIPLSVRYFAIAIITVILIDMFFNVPLYFCRQKYITMFSIALVLSEIAYYRRHKIIATPSKQQIQTAAKN
jgi:hypothetical protein